MTELVTSNQLGHQVTLLDLVDRLLGKGIVIRGDITLALADVDLVYISLQAMISSVSAIAEDQMEPT